MIIGEKWITYDNPTKKKIVDKERRKGASNRKTWIDEEEDDVVCVCGGTGRESFTMSSYCPIKQLIPNSTVNNCRDYNKQLRKRSELINKRGVVFHHDNARPHTSLMTRQKLRELGWEVLMHPLYSSDIAPLRLSFV